MTLYERLGGEPGVTALLDELYVRTLTDPLFTPFFERTDLPRLKGHQHAFISQALGGPLHHTGPSLLQAHAHLKIEQRHFDAFVAHLDAAVRHVGAGDHLKEEVMSMVRPLSGVIVNTPS